MRPARLATATAAYGAGPLQAPSLGPPPAPSAAPEPQQRPARAAAPAASYRPDIDGLRAVAVLSVLFYHLGLARFVGGYVGVDVFFVISGFLITRLIKEQVEAGTFTFRGFYVRRARRLFPALLATSAASLIAAVVLLAPERLEEFGSSVVYASFWLSNWFFFRHSDYFAANAVSRPLLHTWSLSVEEQFYLVWPTLMLIVLGATRRRWAPWAILAAGIVSLAATAWLDTHTAAVFYLTPFRGFEFAIGALVVWLGEGVVIPNGVREIGLPLGLAMIAVSVVGLGTRTFSDIALLTPCLGAALVIWCGEARVTGAILRNRVAAGIGLISYSMYLVHWPLLVFVQYRQVGELTVAEQWAVVGATFAAATAMYLLVERRFRIRSRAAAARPQGRFFLGYAAALAVVVGISAHIARHGGWLWRLPTVIQQQVRAESIAADEDYTWRAFRAAQHPFALDGRRRVMLIGDSQGADVANMLAATGRSARVDFEALEVDMECQALISFAAAQFEALDRADRASCAPFRTALADTASIARADEVILALNWDRRGTPFIDAAVRRLHQWGVRKVYVVGRKSQGASGPALVFRFGLGPGLEERSARRRNAIAWDANARIASLRSDFVYVDLMSQVCPTADRCRVLTDAQDIVFFDGTHFTPAGARYIGDAVMRAGIFDF